MDARHFDHLKPGIAGNMLGLLQAYARRPLDVPRHLRHIARRPIDSGLPMLTFGAIDYLAAQLRPDMTVFEFGCGGSTVFFARRCRMVVAVEDRPKWRERVANAVDSKNAIIVHKPRNEHPEALSQPYDVILVDGTADRRLCFERADEYVKPGGIVILDDAWWPIGISSRRTKLVLEFAGVGPYRYLPSRTDVFVY